MQIAAAEFAAFQHGVNGTEHEGERSAEFMADIGEEIGFYPIQAAEFISLFFDGAFVLLDAFCSLCHPGFQFFPFQDLLAVAPKDKAANANDKEHGCQHQEPGPEVPGWE